MVRMRFLRIVELLDDPPLGDVHDRQTQTVVFRGVLHVQEAPIGRKRHVAGAARDVDCDTGRTQRLKCRVDHGAVLHAPNLSLKRRGENSGEERYDGFNHGLLRKGRTPARDQERYRRKAVFTITVRPRPLCPVLTGPADSSCARNRAR